MAKRQLTPRQYDRLIQDYIRKKEIVKIFRTVTDGEANIHGFILEMSNDFLLIQTELEFYLNGYAVIRKDHFDSLRCNKFDKAFKKILTKEGIVKSDYGISKKIHLKNWQTIFASLKSHDLHIILECEDLKEPVFLIGPIKKVNNKSVSIQYYDPSGKLDKTATKVNYKDITLVKFDDRYLNVFRKYLKASRK